MKNLRFKRPILWPVTLITLLLIAAAMGFAFSRMPQNTNALQIRPARAGLTLPDGFFVYQSLNERGIRIKSITPVDDGLIVQLDSGEQRMLAERALQDILPMGFSIKLCEPTQSPSWVKKLSGNPLKVG
ncbi:EnvZ/OmpR regulon moderator MzrA [Ewingella americana]|jgi:hypothetical protein|uniref:Modulator protein MzrA n=1 Tax=Ewingella americana TaxID=41202 RepID=A0A502GK48_9GAMM|nr:EnvZ/OmpR regulon moderator MzrA [Ewingella americana]TPG61922.1 EnvZ/OmpR regulon moderator MzrA [Ewingella americana]